MERCRFRRWWLIPTGLVLAPTVLWLLIVIAAPTSWARNRFVGSIQKATGRSVRLEGLSVRFLGGVRLSNLEIGAPGTVDDPWLRARELTLDLSPLSLIRGSMSPKQLDVYDATLRILRRQDGTLELSDLVRPAGSGQEGQSGEADCCVLGRCLTGAHRLNIAFHRAIVFLVDERNSTRHELSNVEGEATLEGKSGGVFALDGVMNGGPVQLSGRFDRTLKEPSFDIEVEASNVTINHDFSGLRYLIPVLTGEQTQIEGKLSGQVSLQARGADVETLGKSLRGRGALTLEPVRLQGSSFLDTISKAIDLPATRVSESIRSQFRIQDQRITTQSSTIQLGSIPLKLTGWTDFNGNLDYRINLESMTGRIPDKAIRFLREMDLDVEKLGDLQLRGTLDRLTVQLDGEVLQPGSSGDPSRMGDDRDRLRELGRRLLDRVVR